MAHCRVYIQPHPSGSLTGGSGVVEITSGEVLQEWSSIAIPPYTFRL